MTESNVVQLARFNTTNFASNTEWTTTLKQPIILNQGDTAVVSKAYLDTRLNTGGNIVIPTDLPLSITMYFYMMFPPDGTSLNIADGTPAIDLPQGPIVNPTAFPPNAPPALSAASSLNPTDLTLYACPYLATWTSFQPAPLWEPYQFGSQGFDGQHPQPLNDGVPVPPYASFNTPPVYNYPRSATQNANTINQSWAGELPLLLVTTPKTFTPPTVDDSVPYTKIWNYTLKAGSYSPDQLAEIITRAMSSISPTNSDQLANNYNAFTQFGTGNAGANDKNAFLAKGQQIAIIPEPNNTQARAIPMTPYIDGVWKDGMAYTSNDPSFNQQVGSYQADCILASFVAGCDIPPAYLNEINATAGGLLNPLCFQQIKFQAGWSAVQDPNGRGIPVDNIPPAAAQTIFQYTTPIIGCPQPELLYNDQAGLFQFGYTHTPLLELPSGGGVPGQNTGTNPIEVVKIIKTTNIDFREQAASTINNEFYFAPATSQVNITEHTKHSGVLFKSMEPASFWQGILGFDLPNICFPQEAVWGSQRTITYPQFFNATTSGFVGLANNFNYNNIGDTTDNLNQPPYLGPVPLYPTKAGADPEGTGELTYTNLLNSARWFGEQYLLKNNNLWGVVNPPGPIPYKSVVYNFPYATFFPFFYEEYASALAATNPISAIIPPLSNVENVGHFLIEIVAYGADKEFINNDTVYQVKSILSSYYNSAGSFQTSPFPDSYVYTHTGETQIIHSFKVRIIDPYTMNTATNIGPSSSVYLQFNKQLTPVVVAQPE